MHFSFITLLGIFLVTKAQFLSCPLLGPDFPPPTNLQSDTSIIAASQNLTAQLDTLAANNVLSTSFSVQWFSAETNQPLFEYHYTAPSVASSSNGVKNITSDSIYRIGSISKLYTVYLFLAEAGDQYFNRPITDFVPELATAALDSNGTSDIDATRWEDITVGSLASQLSGIGRDDGETDLLSINAPWTDLGLPTLTADELPTCGFNASVPACTRSSFLQGLIKRNPVFAPFTSPVYSNNAFGVLFFALETITNKSFSDMMASMYTQLNLSSTSYTTPTEDTNGVIPWNISYSGWDLDEAASDPSGSIYASTNDLSSFGRAILNNALISPTATRRWMKPMTFTSSSTLSVGAPWEIYRTPSLSNPQILVDYYTKGGDIGVYSSLLALLPSYSTGFSIFAADGNVEDVAATLSNIAASTFSTALEEAAKSQASTLYSGTYITSSSSILNTTNDSNSTLTLSTDSKNGFGISINTWTNNGKDIFPDIKLTQGISPGSTNQTLLARLVPTNLSFKNETTGNVKKAFRAVLGFEGAVDTGNVFDLNCATWTTVDALAYGGVAIDLFVFEMGTDGSVAGVKIPALQTTLERV